MFDNKKFSTECRSGQAQFDLVMEAHNMKYMLLVYLDEQAMTEAEREHCYVESAQLAQDLNSSGQYLDASPLHPVATATSLRVRDGRRVVTDGPFAETREQLGGYYLIEANDLDEAIAIAERIPPARFGTIEIRPVMEIGGLPGDQNVDLVTAGSTNN
jgi:hypothetical protein